MAKYRIRVEAELVAQNFDFVDKKCDEIKKCIKAQKGDWQEVSAQVVKERRKNGD